MQIKLNLMKWNKEFPYRTLNEIFTLDEIIEVFNSGLFYKSISFKETITTLAKYFYDMYGLRYPYEQHKTRLTSLISQLRDTYLDTFITSTIRLTNNADISQDNLYNYLLKGNTLTYTTKAGISANPYDVSYNKPEDITGNDNLMEKRISGTTQENNNTDIVKRTTEMLYGKLSGEVQNFINSFYSLFTQIDLSAFIENNLNIILSNYKTVVNTIISRYNYITEKLDKTKEG